MSRPCGRVAGALVGHQGHDLMARIEDSRLAFVWILAAESPVEGSVCRVATVWRRDQTSHAIGETGSGT